MTINEEVIWVEETKSLHVEADIVMHKFIIAAVALNNTNHHFFKFLNKEQIDVRILPSKYEIKDSNGTGSLLPFKVCFRLKMNFV